VEAEENEMLKADVSEQVEVVLRSYADTQLGKAVYVHINSPLPLLCFSQMSLHSCVAILHQGMAVLDCYSEV